MHIEPTHGFDTHGVPEGARNVPPSEPAASANERKRPDSPPAGPAEMAWYIEEAAAAEPVRADAVAEARRLLARGDLDTPEAARQAAETLLTLGI